METTITGKNQVTLPAVLVRELGIGPGTKLRWSIGEGGTLVGVPRPSRRVLAEGLLGKGRRYLDAGCDPVADLIAERAADEPEGGPGSERR